MLFMIASVPAFAQQEDEAYHYQRNSIYPIFIKHPQYAYNKEIEYVLGKNPMPERFNDHALKVRNVVFSSKDKDLKDAIDDFIQQNQLARRVVSKWFNHTKSTGFDMELIKERGFYNATAADWDIAARNAIGNAMLEDAGENLIGNTFVIFHDIRYIDRSTAWNTVKEIAIMATAVASSIVLKNNDVGSMMLDSDLGGKGLDWLYGSVTDKIKGFAVNITSYLYRLSWNEDIANEFYAKYYTADPQKDQSRIAAYNADNKLFKLEYVGMVQSKSSKTVMSGVKTNEQLIRKVCTRAVDKNLAELQHEFGPFRIKAPLVSTTPLCAHVGMKEDLTADSRFEVLEPQLDKDGRTTYKKVGVIRPVDGKIWDNRYGADEEDTPESKLHATEFEKVSGSDFYPGMLIREIEK